MFYHQNQSLPSGLLPSGFGLRIPYAVFISSMHDFMPHTSYPSWFEPEVYCKNGNDSLCVQLSVSLCVQLSVFCLVCVFSYQYFVCLLFRMEQETSSSVTVVHDIWLCWGFFQGIFKKYFEFLGISLVKPALLCLWCGYCNSTVSSYSDYY
jgi:hypothetical protein